MATDYEVDGSRIGVDGAGAVSWSAVCDTPVAGWNEGNQLIISISATSSSHTPGTESFQIRWRVSGGSFAAITDAGALRNGLSAGYLSNVDPVGSGAGCQGAAIGGSEETENESPQQTAGLSAGTKNDSVEVQACIDMSNAVYSAVYEFELYSITETETCGQALATITIRANPAGWSATIDGVENPTHVDGIAVANINNVDGI